MRILVPGLIAAGLLLVAPALAAPETSIPPTRESEPVADAKALEAQARARLRDLAKAGLDDCADARVDLVAVARAPAFSQLPEPVRRATLASILTCTRTSDDHDTLFAAELLAPIAASPVERGLVHYHLMGAGIGKDNVKAARHLLALMDSYPAMVSGWEARWFGPMVLAAKQDQALELGLLSRLVGADWRTASSRDASRVWWRMDLARRQSELKNVIALRDTLRPVDDPDSLVSVALDRRFEPLWTEMETAGRFDWTALAQANLAAKRQLLADEPNRLFHLMALMDALRLTDGAEEAAALGQAARAKLSTPGSFVDQDDNAAWLLLKLTSVLSDLGRDAEVDAVFAEALPLSDKSGDRISQRVNWAGHLLQAGRPAEALKLLEAISDDDGSPYGLGWRDSNKVCALSEVNRKQAEALLAKMQMKWDDNPSSVYQALLCLGRVEEAAALLVKRLETPKHRDGAIGANLMGARNPRPPTPFVTRLLATREKVLARPEVVAALARYSRPITVPYGGDYATVY